LNFGSVVINQTSTIKTFTLKNNQAISLGITSLTVPAGGYAFDPSTTCANPGSLGAGALHHRADSYSNRSGSGSGRLADHQHRCHYPADGGS
jgi:hypothetical protein